MFGNIMGVRLLCNDRHSAMIIHRIPTEYRTTIRWLIQWWPTMGACGGLSHSIMAIVCGKKSIMSFPFSCLVPFSPWGNHSLCQMVGCVSGCSMNALIGSERWYKFMILGLYRLRIIEHWTWGRQMIMNILLVCTGVCTSHLCRFNQNTCYYILLYWS